MKVNPRSIGIEGKYLANRVDDLARFKARLQDLGVPATTAAGITAWLVDKSAGMPDQTSQDTRARYRRLLRDLTEQGLLTTALLATPIILEEETADDLAPVGARELVGSAA